MTAFVFYLFAALAIASGAMVVTARNPVHSVLFLILTFFNVAGLFILLGAEFVAMIMVIVYVGAVAVLFLFVVMMLDIHAVTMREGFLKILPMGAAVALVLFAEMSLVFATWMMAPDLDAVRAAAEPPLTEMSNTEAIGSVLYTDYIYLFQMAGIVLLIGMIGSIMLTMRARVGVKRQNPHEQATRPISDCIEIKKVATGKGV
ncbi:MAG: NADH-quinone oxidoreductase subunit J [Rhodospirillaceae bacterium]|nr:NADH-quinone oxidoreductase subunit J [Rhodospirillaceae bacterium]